MKPEDIEKALKLRDNYRATVSQLEELQIADRLDIFYFQRRVIIYKDDPKFFSIRLSMEEFLKLRINNIIREGNQIGLTLGSVIQ